MNLNQLKYLIREGVAELLNEKAKKKLTFVSDKPDPLHHLQGSKKLGGSNKNKKKDDDEKLKKDFDDDVDCEECDEDDISDAVKVFHEKSDDDQHESLKDFKFSVGDNKKKNQKADKNIKTEGYHKVSLHEDWKSMLGIKKANPDDDNGQRAYDTQEMKLMRGWYKDQENNSSTENQFFDASQYKLCYGKDETGSKSEGFVSLKLIFKLLNELVDILDDCDASVMTISPYSVGQAKKLYPRSNSENGLNLFVICLGVAEQNYNLWDQIDFDETSILYEEYGKPDVNEGWFGFWNWILKNLVKARTVSTRLFSALPKNGNSNQGVNIKGVNCYFTKGLVEDIQNSIDKFNKMKSHGELNSQVKDKTGRYEFLLKMLESNKWMYEVKKDVNGDRFYPELTDIQRANIKAEIKKMRRDSNENWMSWGKRKLGLDDEET